MAVQRDKKHKICLVSFLSCEMEMGKITLKSTAMRGR